MRSSTRHPPVLKRLGQHFLTDTRILDRIVGGLSLTGAETVVEIGPGRGSLTDRLVDKCAKLVAVEVDQMLVPILRARYASRPHVSIVEGDVLDMPLGKIAGGQYVLIGNVPYYITTPILFHALERPRAERSVFLVQREVAERLAAAPNTEAYGALSINVQAVASVSLMFRVPAGAFTPAPRVESAVVLVTPRRDPVVEEGEEAGFRRFVQSAFAQRRKQLKSVIRGIAGVDTAEAIRIVERAGIVAEVRPEVLSPVEFARLYRVLTDRAEDLGSGI